MLHDPLAVILEFVERAGIQYMLVGSYASSACDQGYPDTPPPA